MCLNYKTMALVFFKNEGAGVKLKATVHSATGKLGFTDATAKHLKLDIGKYVQFATDDNDPTAFYMINNTDKDSENSFEVKKAGDYFSVNIKTLLDKRECDYTNYTIIFDMVQDYAYEGLEVYKLKERKLAKKKK